MEKTGKKEYSNGEITVVWQPSKCIHSGICVKTLPKVYNPDVKPWIKVENASTEQLIAQIKKCPSGALSYYLNNANEKGQHPLETKVEVLENGPLLVEGKLTVVDKDGKAQLQEGTTAFCRCGQSKDKPYCDGTHKDIGFEG